MTEIKILENAMGGVVLDQATIDKILKIKNVAHGKHLPIGAAEALALLEKVVPDSREGIERAHRVPTKESLGEIEMAA